MEFWSVKEKEDWKQLELADDGRTRISAFSDPGR